ncbi:MAG: hypothetical protein LBV33_08325, partial [Lachnospiraceae bacterium]|nr:hypothetical protein [Lachnospiraceae bacterium]
MERKVFQGFLAVEAVVCIALCFLKVSPAGVFSVAIAFPFEQIGMGLRALSLSGGWGNGVAIVIYLVIGLLPIGLLLWLSKRRKLHWADGLLVVLSVVLLVVLYLMVNPGSIAMLGKIAAPPIGKAILGSAVYSLVVGYLILQITRLFTTGRVQKLERPITVLLDGLNALFIFMVFGAGFSDLLDSITALQAGNSGNEHMLGASYIFLRLGYVVKVLPYVLNIVVVFAAKHLFDEMQKERYSAGAVAAAERMVHRCAMALTITTITNITFNLLQLLFAQSLMILNYSVE